MKGVPLTQTERQQITDLRKGPPSHTYQQITKITGRPYNTVAHICRDAGLQREPKKIIILIHDPADIFSPGPIEWNQADLAYMLNNSNLQDGFTIDVGKYRLEVQNNCFFRSDGMICPANESGSLKWYHQPKEQTK